jgi:2,4-dienoyl-CoA reductase-like NADH-dependent reductase (Old Yellow Enzyme family)
MSAAGFAANSGVTGIEELLERLGHNEFDLVAIGRSLIVNPDWARLVREGRLDQLKPFTREALATLAT